MRIEEYVTDGDEYGQNGGDPGQAQNQGQLGVPDAPGSTAQPNH